MELRNSSTSALIATYRYDALARRVEKALSGAATTRYVFDGLEVVEEYDGSDNWQALYVYEDGIDRPRCMDRADIADVNGNGNTIEILRFHYHQQGLGCVTEMTQPTGAVVEWVTYDVYGHPTIRDMNGNIVGQSAIGNPYLFAGREYDPESGHYFYRVRTYDPISGRFLQTDPVGYCAGSSLYEYVRSSPVGSRDPSELRDEEGNHERINEALKDQEKAREDEQEAEVAVSRSEKRLQGIREAATASEPSAHAVLLEAGSNAQGSDDMERNDARRLGEARGALEEARRRRTETERVYAKFYEVWVVNYANARLKGKKYPLPATPPAPPVQPSPVTAPTVLEPQVPEEVLRRRRFLDPVEEFEFEIEPEWYEGFLPWNWRLAPIIPAWPIDPFSWFSWRGPPVFGSTVSG